MYSSVEIVVIVGSKGDFVMHLGMLRRVLLILGCLLFLSSTILPFLHEDCVYGEEDFDLDTDWSFKSSSQQIRNLRSGEPVEYWFYDYWVRECAGSSELLLVFAFLFVIQILALIAGTASVFLSRRILDLAPAFLCSMVTALMVLVGTSLRPWENKVYLSGYWLTYPSLLFFVAAFILSLIIHKKQTKLT